MQSFQTKNQILTDTPSFNNFVKLVWHYPPLNINQLLGSILHSFSINIISLFCTQEHSQSSLPVYGYNIFIMITLKSSSSSFRSSAKVLNIEITPQNNNITRINRLISHKIKRLQQSDLQRQSKAVKMLQNLQFLQFLPDYCNSPRLHEEKAHDKTGRMSSYLAYKQQQKVMKAKHNQKMSSLKSKYLQQKSIKQLKQKHQFSHRLICTQQDTRTNKKMSFVDIQATVSEECQYNNFTKIRQIYMKTSEGKRQKMDAHLYFRKLRAKFDSDRSIEPQINPSFARFPEYLQCQSIFPIKSYSTQVHQQTAASTFRKLRSRSTKKQSHFIYPDDGVTCRPWSSGKSELGQDQQ